MFVSLTSEIRWCGTKELTEKLSRSVDYICDYIYDLEWQYSVNPILRKNTENQRAIFIVLRLLHAKDIEEHNIKSYYRYNKQKNCLAIDIVFSIEDYVNLSEKEIVQNLSKAIYEYIYTFIGKYDNKIKDFDVAMFLSVLDERLKGLESKLIASNEPPVK